MLKQIKVDKWLSSELNQKVYFIQNDIDLKKNDVINSIKSFIEKLKNSKCFVYSKIDTKDIKKVHFFENLGFKVVDTNITFETKQLIDQKSINNNINFEFAKKSYQKSIFKIAHDNFLYSRFHLDPDIENSIASKIKGNWAKNFFYGKRGDKMVVALRSQSPVGFVQLIEKKDNLIIDLIAVDKNFQGKKIASGMISFIEKKLNFRNFTVGTQISNVPSIRLYEKIGFRQVSSHYILHYHSK